MRVRPAIQTRRQPGNPRVPGVRASPMFGNSQLITRSLYPNESKMLAFRRRYTTVAIPGTISGCIWEDTQLVGWVADVDGIQKVYVNMVKSPVITCSTVYPRTPYCRTRRVQHLSHREDCADFPRPGQRMPSKQSHCSASRQRPQLATLLSNLQAFPVCYHPQA